MSESLEQEISKCTAKLAAELIRQNKTLAVAESCTGGWLAKVLTDMPGSSEWFMGGVVSYSNGAKQALLNVSAEDIKTFGAVSDVVAEQMAEGVLTAFDSSISIAITGVAGPLGGSEKKPVGYVCYAFKDTIFPAVSSNKLFTGTREVVRQQAVLSALLILFEALVK